MMGVRASGKFAVVGFVVALCVAPTLQAQQSAGRAVKLEIHADKPTAKVSPIFYGLMTEEINHAFDGGLYAEMVRNRTMRETWGRREQLDRRHQRKRASHRTGRQNHWTVRSRCRTVESFGNGRYSANSAGGVRNDGYWGMAVMPNTSYSLNFYAKAADAAIGEVSVRLVNDQTGAVVASNTINTLTTNWKYYVCTLATRNATRGVSHHLEFTVTHPGTMWLSLVRYFRRRTPTARMEIALT